jgi:hypothetical protein
MPAVVLTRGQVAYVVIDGSDEPHAGTPVCPAPFTKFEIDLPGIEGTFVIEARVPNYVDYFPSCSPLGVTAVLPADDVIGKVRQPA